MKRLTNSTMTFLLTIVALVGCRNDFDFEEAHNKIYSDNVVLYNESFKEAYGDIPSHQKWDFSAEGTKIEGKTRANGVTTTFVDGINWGLSNSTTVTENLTLYNQIKTSLPDGIQHTGNQAVLTAPANSFTIYPLTAQGGYTHDLYVKVGDEPEIMIYSKYWDDWTKPYCHGMRTSGSETVSMPGYNSSCRNSCSALFKECKRVFRQEFQYRNRYRKCNYRGLSSKTRRSARNNHASRGND